MYRRAAPQRSRSTATSFSRSAGGLHRESGQQPAVDRNDGPGHVRRRGDPADDRGDLLCARHPSERDLRDDPGAGGVVDAGDYLGVGQARNDEVHRDRLAGELDREHLRETGQTGLGGAVGAVAGEAPKADDRAEVDDRPSGRHVRRREPAELERGHEVDVDHRAEVARLEPSEPAAPVDPGVVDEHVDAPEPLRGGVDGRGERLGIGHVGPHCDPSDLPGDGVDLLAARDEDDVGAGGRGPAGDGGADAPGRPGHEPHTVGHRWIQPRGVDGGRHLGLPPGESSGERVGWSGAEVASSMTQGTMSLDAALGPEPEASDVSVDYRAAIRAYNDVAEALLGEPDLDRLLHLVAKEICSLLHVRRCSVYLREGDDGLFRGQVGHADTDIDPLVKRLVAGVEADRFTQEILRTRRPVLLADALADPRPIRSTMRAWNVRSMLGVPMLVGGEVTGIVFLDNEDEPHAFTPADQELAATFANLAAIAISQAQLTARLRSSIRTAASQNQLLRRGAEVEERLTRLVLDGANLREIAEVVAELTGKPCAISDASFRCRAVAAPPGVDLEPLRPLLERRWAEASSVQDALRDLSARTALVGPVAADGLHHRLVIAPVLARDERWGYLVVAEVGGRIGALDGVIVDRAATIVALELSAERRAAAAENDALEALASDLIRGGRDEQSLERRADFLGVRLSSPHVLCLIAAPQSDVARTPTARRAMAVLRPIEPGLRVFAGSVAEGVLAVLELPSATPGTAAVDRAKEAVTAACAELAPTHSLSIALSSVCRRPADYERAYAEVRQVLRCIDAFCPRGELRILAADDLGIGRLLLSATDRRDADRFVTDTLDGLLAGGDGRSTDLLATLQVFFACSRSVRRSATYLGVHENTIRYRLSRIEAITGLRVASDADDQLTVQLALLVMRLEGALPDVVAGAG